MKHHGWLKFAAGVRIQNGSVASLLPLGGEARLRLLARAAGLHARLIRRHAAPIAGEQVRSLNELAETLK